MAACEALYALLWVRDRALPHQGFSGRIWAVFGGQNGAPGETQRRGFAGERRRSGMSEFSPFWVETRDMELVPTMSRRKP